MAEKTRVDFLGPTASFSHQAAVECFGKDVVLFPQPSFGDAFAAVQSNEADYAVIPLENSTNGSVVQTLDLLADRESKYGDLTVCGEYYLTVHHCLLAKFEEEPASQGRPRIQEGQISDNPRYKNISKLYTHPQAWGQCERFLSRYFKGIERQDVSSTSKAAEIVAQESTSAAIASRFAAEFHKVQVLAENIEDAGDNTTRFIVLRNLKAERTAVLPVNLTSVQADSKPRRKSLISFILDHNSPGALANALAVFKAHGINLASINTRPGGIRAWQYIFFVECREVAESPAVDAVKKAVEDLQSVTEACRHLGSWIDQLQ